MTAPLGVRDAIAFLPIWADASYLAHPMQIGVGQLIELRLAVEILLMRFGLFSANARFPALLFMILGYFRNSTRKFNKI